MALAVAQHVVQAGFATGPSVAFPGASTAGNLLLLIVGNDAQVVPSVPAGWTAADPGAGSSGGPQGGRIFYKTSAGETSVTLSGLSNSGNGQAMWEVSGWSGVDAPFALSNAPATANTVCPTGSLATIDGYAALAMAMVFNRAAGGVTYSAISINGTNAGATTNEGAGATGNAFSNVGFDAPITSTSGAYSGTATISISTNFYAGIAIIGPPNVPPPQAIEAYADFELSTFGPF